MKNIKEMREEIIRFLAHEDKEEKDILKAIYDARHTMNSYYRLCGLSGRVFELVNNEYFYDKPYTKELEAKENRWFKRLAKVFLTRYGYTLHYNGIYPGLYHMDDNTGCIKDQLYIPFYE